MYFDINIKEEEADFYNYKIERARLWDYLQSKEKLIVITGLRRVGKTSLLRVEYNRLNQPRVFMDARNYTDPKVLLNKAFEQIYTQLDPTRIIFQNLTSIDLGPFSIDIGNEKPVSLKHIDSLLKKQSKHAYIFIDEVQKIKGIGDLIAHVYDFTRHITFVLSGSEVGLINKLFERDASLFGRLHMNINLKPLDRSKSLEFLRIGFAQIGKQYNDSELNDAVDELDGLIGWLTYYGYLRGTLEHDDALSKLKKDARVLLLGEVSKFISEQRGEKSRYMHILKSLRSGYSEWSVVKNILESRIKTKISSARFTDYLKKLEAYGFIVREKKGYRLADPLLKLL